MTYYAVKGVIHTLKQQRASNSRRRLRLTALQKERKSSIHC